MSAGVPSSQLRDLIQTTLENLPDNKIEVALNYESHVVVNEWLRSNRVQLEGGESISRRVILDHSGTARHVRLYQATTPTVTDVVRTITAPWCNVQSDYSFDEREILRNRPNATQIVNLIKTRRLDAMLSLADLLEERAWATPNSATDDLNPRGLPYWLCMLNDGVTSDGDFLGETVRYYDSSTSTQTTGTTRAGLDSDTLSKWRNYAFTYSTVNRSLITQMRTASYKTNFKPPIIIPNMSENAGQMKRRIYMNTSTIVAFEELAHTQNDQLGGDIARYLGATLFNRIPLVQIPQLDDFTVVDGGDSDFSPEPIFAVNHNHFYPYIQQGYWLKESEPMNDRNQHNVFTVFVDGSYQFFCNNLRQAGWVGHISIPSS